MLLLTWHKLWVQKHSCVFQLMRISSRTAHFQLFCSLDCPLLEICNFFSHVQESSKMLACVYPSLRVCSVCVIPHCQAFPSALPEKSVWFSAASKYPVTLQGQTVPVILIWGTRQSVQSSRQEEQVCCQARTEPKLFITKPLKKKKKNGGGGAWKSTATFRSKQPPPLHELRYIKAAVKQNAPSEMLPSQGQLYRETRFLLY